MLTSPFATPLVFSTSPSKRSSGIVRLWSSATIGPGWTETAGRSTDPPPSLPTLGQGDGDPLLSFSFSFSFPFPFPLSFPLASPFVPFAASKKTIPCETIKCSSDVSVRLGPIPSGHSVRLLPSNLTSIRFILVGLLSRRVRRPRRMAGGASGGTI